METLHEYDIVALTERIQAYHLESGKLIVLQRGQIGTIMMVFHHGEVAEIDFCNPDGTSFATLAVPSSKLMLLHNELIETV
jgi:hypothetical protein